MIRFEDGVDRDCQQYFSYIVAVSLFVEGAGVHGENHRPVSIHWQTLSHNIYRVHLVMIRTRSISGDRNWLHMVL